VNLLAALDAAGAEPALFPAGHPECEARFRPAVEAALARADAFDPHAPCLRVSHPFDLALRAGRGPLAGYSFFEADDFTARELHHLRSLDLALAPSAWARDLLVAAGVRRVAVARPGVDLAAFHPGVVPASRAALGVPDSSTLFVTAGKWSLNKGHDFLLDAMNAAFGPAADVALVAACFNLLDVPGVFDGPAESLAWGRRYLASPLGAAGKLRVLRGRLPAQADLASLMAAADCCVFLSRGEGFNLECAESLAMGRPVIATDCTAHSDYCGEGGAALVTPDGTEPADDGVFLRGTGNWARLGPDALDQAVAHLRAAHARRQAEGRTDNPAGAALFRDRRTWAACAAAALTALESL
jgi:glycosyltransferase involved in cell wall biosynthesis